MFDIGFVFFDTMRNVWHNDVDDIDNAGNICICHSDFGEYWHVTKSVKRSGVNIFIVLTQNPFTYKYTKKCPFVRIMIFQVKRFKNTYST